MKMNHHDFTTALNQNYAHYLKAVHLFLNQLYYTTLFNQDEKYALDEIKIRKLKQLEDIWIKHEMNECLRRYDCNQTIKDPQIIYYALRSHPVFNHPLYDYLCYEANYIDLQQYILNESVLNLEFFDYLALSLIGTSDEAKAEIAANLWDEAGRGEIPQFHSNLYKKLMLSLGLKYDREVIIENMVWEGIAGINLFSHLSLHPVNKIKYYGLLAATEMLDPPHYQKLIKGVKRIIGSQHIDYQYYIEHKTIDVEHAFSWVNKVILPILQEKPAKTQDFWLGFYLRLDSVNRYYDRLLNFFMNKKAA